MISLVADERPFIAGLDAAAKAIAATNLLPERVGEAVSYGISDGHGYVGLVVRTYPDGDGQLLSDLVVPDVGMMTAKAAKCIRWHGDIPRNGGAA
jgi:hypothetical protein